MKREYLVIFERGREGQENWGAYVPDLPGCITTGETREEAERYIREAIELHIEGMIEDGIPVPEPRSEAGVVSIAVAIAA
jgi:predicted RNase H-like HicB family nuclease